MENIIIFSHPVTLILFIVTAILVILDILIKRISFVFKLVFLLSLTALTVFLLLYGAAFEEIIIVVLLFLLAYLFDYFVFRKKGEN